MACDLDHVTAVRQIPGSGRGVQADPVLAGLPIAGGGSRVAPINRRSL